MTFNLSCKIENNKVICEADVSEYMKMMNAHRSGSDMGHQDVLSAFINRVKSKRDCFVVVYAEWCGHCQTLKGKCGQDWDKVMERNGQANILLLDGDQDRQVINTLAPMGVNVTGYPSIFANFIASQDHAGNLIKQYNGKMNKFNLPRELFVKEIKETAKTM